MATLCLLFVACSSAQEQAPTSSAGACPGECKAAITGIVRDALTGAPVPRAMILARGPQQFATQADGDGVFQFQSMPLGAFTLLAHKPGYLATGQIGTMAESRLDSTGNATVILQLNPSSAIVGKISDSNGIPVGSVSVMALQHLSGTGRSSWKMVGSAETDGRGRYRIASLPAGRYCLWTRPHLDRDEFAPSKGEPVSGFVPAHFPCAPDAPDQALDLGAGQELAADLHVRETRFVTISGTLPQHEYANLSLALYSDLPSVEAYYLTASSDGTFHSEPVPPGKYLLIGQMGRQNSDSLVAKLTINARSDIADLRVPFIAAVSIPVIITSDGPPAQTPPLPSGVSVEATRVQPSSAWVYISPADRPERGAMLSRRTDGTLTFEGVIPGEYNVTVTPSGGQYVASATYAGIDVLHGATINVLPGSSRESINVVLRSDCARINGRARGGASPMIFVGAVPNTGGHPQVSQLDAQGQFSFRCLKPGNYRVGFMTDVDGYYSRGPSDSNPLLQHARDISVDADQQVSLELNLLGGSR